jgi:predicted HAD superfamily phosphohydrolase YqeG
MADAMGDNITGLHQITVLPLQTPEKVSGEARR